MAGCMQYVRRNVELNQIDEQPHIYINTFENGSSEKFDFSKMKCYSRFGIFSLKFIDGKLFYESPHTGLYRTSKKINNIFCNYLEKIILGEEI